MCEIQIIQKLGKEKISKADLGEFFKMMCFGSMNNNDAFGVFNRSIAVKYNGAFNPSKLNECDLIDEDFIIGHNRLSTEYSNIKNSRPSLVGCKSTSICPPKVWNWARSFGDNMSNIFLPTQGLGVTHFSDEEDKENFYEDSNHNRNNHPFELGGFTLIHNGVIYNAQDIYERYNFRTNITTDSYIILKLIDYYFNKSTIKDRVRRITTAIQRSCKELHGGYSVVLYDKNSKKTFYFKNMFASFHLCKYGDKILCGSTSRSNLDYIYFGEERENILMKSDRVYLLTSDVKHPVVDVTLPLFKPLRSRVLYNILTSNGNPVEKINKLDRFLESSFGFIPLYGFTRKGDLKIATNNADGIKEKIHMLTKNPKRWFGWYVIKISDIKPVIKKRKKVKLKKLKGGKK